MVTGVGGTVRAVYENGVLRPKQPLELAEGEEVNIRILEAEVTRQQKIAVLRAKIAQRLANPPDPDEGEAVSWEEFHAFLQDNRFDLPERDLGLNDE